MSAINFFCEDVAFELKNEKKIKTWLSKTIQAYDLSLDPDQDLNYIFCSDQYLHQMNVDYLQHDTLTDVITFDNSEDEEQIAGDIFISIDRIQENAQNFGVNFEQELHRVIVHGLLHLIGFGDKTEQEAQMMRTKENEHLSLLQ